MGKRKNSRDQLEAFFGPEWTDSESGEVFDFDLLWSKMDPEVQNYYLAADLDAIRAAEV